MGIIRSKSYYLNFSLLATITLLIISSLNIAAQPSRSATIRVVTLNDSNQPISAVTVQIKLKGASVRTAATNEQGLAEFPNIAPGVYEVAIVKDGFEPLSQNDIQVTAGAQVEIKFTLIPRIEIKEGIEIRATGANPVEQGASTSTEFQRTQLYDLANKPTNVADTLPLVPGVSRSPNGEINISGSGEHRSALVVNSADVTEPATGQFGMTIPVDSVEKIEVFKSPFLAQYGRFTAGVVSVETRRGGEKWNFDVHDPLPAFRFRSGHLAGMLNASPRVVFNGPLIKNRLYLSEGIEYRLFKDPVYTLPHPNRETKSESVNSFTQLDYIVSGTHTLTGTVHIAPRKVLYSGLNFFDPRPVTPNFSARDYTGMAIDRLTIGGHLLESTIAVKKYGSDVWGQERDEMSLTPTGNRGSYFSEQDRNASRFEWLEQFTFKPIEANGKHNLRIGGSIARTRNRGQFIARPINILDIGGNLARRIEFDDGNPFDNTDTEVGVYAQDQWVISPKLALNLGARFERQGISGALRSAPRLGFSWTPFGSQRTIVRGGAGVFYDRVPLNVYAFDHYPDRIITTYDQNGSVIDGPRRYLNFIDRINDHKLSLIHESKTKNNFAPNSTAWVVEIEHPVTSHARLRANYTQSNSTGLIILNPGKVEGQDALVLRGDGRSRYKQLELSAKFTWREEENFFLSYVRSRARGDLNEFNSFLGNFPLPVVRPNQYSNLAADLPNRFIAYGMVKLPWELRFSPMIEYRNGFPFAAIDAYQDYVGLPNSDATRFPNFFSIDLRVSKDFTIKYKGNPYKLRLSFYGYNVTNHFNALDVRRNIADPQFGVFFGKYRRWFKFDFEVFR
jgi:hypothetical protein